MAMNLLWRRCLHSHPKFKTNHYDCIIAGGGLVGSALAAFLANSPLLNNLKILLIEAAPSSDRQLKSKFSNRVSALNNTTKKLFDELDTWKIILSERFQEVKDIKVWGYCSSNNIHFSDSEKKTIAYIVENDVIINSIHRKLQMANNVDILYGTKVLEIIAPKKDNPSEFPEIKLLNNDTYTCQLLVGADGAKSKVRDAINPLYLSWSYHQSAVVATLNILNDNQNTTAWQRFLPEGPIALLPLDKSTSSLVWSTTTEKAKNLLQLSPEDFVDALNTALIGSFRKDDFIEGTQSMLKTLLTGLGFAASTDEVLPPFIKSVEDKSRASFPLEFGHCAKYISPKVVLIGDAAHKVHPLAGQGVNLGFSDVWYLTKALNDGIRQGRGFGDFMDLTTYEKLSQRHNIPMMATIDFLHRLYVTDVGIFKALGDACFQIGTSFEPVKNVMKAFASGLR